MDAPVDIQWLTEICSKSQDVYSALLYRLTRIVYEIGITLDKFPKLKVDRLNVCRNRLDASRSEFQVLESTLNQCFKNASRNTLRRMKRRLEHVRGKLSAHSLKLNESLLKMGVHSDEMQLVCQIDELQSMIAKSANPDQKTPQDGLGDRNPTNRPAQLETSRSNYGESTTDLDQQATESSLTLAEPTWENSVETMIDSGPKDQSFHTLENYAIKSLNSPSAPDEYDSQRFNVSGHPRHCPNIRQNSVVESPGKGKATCTTEVAPSVPGSISSSLDKLSAQVPEPHGVQLDLTAKTKKRQFNSETHCQLRYWLREKTPSELSRAGMAAPPTSDQGNAPSWKRQRTTTTQPAPELANADDIPIERSKAKWPPSIANPNTEITTPTSGICLPSAPASNVNEAIISNERFATDSIPNVVDFLSENVSQGSQQSSDVPNPEVLALGSDHFKGHTSNQDDDVESERMCHEIHRNFPVLFTENFWKLPLEDVELPAEMIDEIDNW